MVSASSKYQTFSIRFYGDLRRFLNPPRRNRSFTESVERHPAIKDPIQASGVPHTEIKYILVDGEYADLTYQIQGGERIRVYPDRPSDLWKPPRGTRYDLEPRWPARKRFICDVHLGRLARDLRLLGFDTLYERDFKDHQIVELMDRERRIILTRDVDLLKRNAVVWGYFVRSTSAGYQLRELVGKFGLRGREQPFRRCLNCNGPIRRVAKSRVLAVLPPKTRRCYQKFFQCGSCGKIYWKGSHYQRLNEKIKRYS
ncbi:MAG: Mut7-C RNAse domain-containing protein [Candidatus Omnitrophota bacterium]